MRFISRNSNLLIVLCPGLPAQPASGLPAKPTVSVRFKDGVADVPEGELCDMMLVHAGFNSDYVSADSTGKDIYASKRTESEPTHVITELKYGTPEKVIVGNSKTKLTPEMQKIVKEAAISLAKEMLPGMIESTLKNIIEAHEQNKKDSEVEKPKGKPGRPPLVKTEKPAETPETVA